MARTKAQRKRGRPPDPHARRRQSTRAGRRGEVDHGSPLLLLRKLTITGRADVPLDPAGILFGRGLLDAVQYAELGEVTALLQRVAKAWGGKDGSVQGLWGALLAAATPTRSSALAVPIGSDAARRRLARTLRQLDGSRALIVGIAESRITPLVVRAAARRLVAEDLRQLERLRAGLDHIAGRR
jgi:hypothetical protein